MSFRISCSRLSFAAGGYLHGWGQDSIVCQQTVAMVMVNTLVMCKQDKLCHNQHGRQKEFFQGGNSEFVQGEPKRFFQWGGKSGEI